MGFHEEIEDIGRRNRIIPAWLRVVIVLPFLGLAAYMMLEDRWIYHWLKNLQLHTMHGYYVLLTALLTILSTLIPAVVVISYVRKYFEKRTEDDPEIVDSEK